MKLNLQSTYFYTYHCVKSVRIRSYSGPYFPAFGLNTEDTVSLRIQSECGKIRTRITPNTDTFHVGYVRSYLQSEVFSWKRICLITKY